MLGTIYWWCVAAFSSGLWNIPTPVDQVLDDSVYRFTSISTPCASSVATRKASREEIRARVAPDVHQRPLGTVCLQQDSEHVCLWPGYHDTAKHGYSSVAEESTGERNGALLSSAMRVGSICMRVMDVHVYGVGLVSVIFRSAFAHYIQIPPQASWCGGHKLQLVVRSGVSAK